jgi:putative phage-type endonuclease
MKIEQDIKQGSIEWLNWRKSGIGGSDVAAILDISPFKSKMDLWLEKTGQKEEQDLSDNFIVQRGHALEPEARELLESMTGEKFPPCIFQHDHMSFMKFSCDGFNGSDKIIEIKANGNKSHQMALNNEVPEYYMLQMQYGLMISNANVCHYVSYNPASDRPLVTFEVKRDELLMSNIYYQVKEFWTENIEKKIKPLTKEERQEIKDADFVAKIAEYREKIVKYNALSDEMEVLENYFKAYLKENKLSNANCNSVFFTKIERKGNIDYEKIPELAGVELEKYRKKGSSYYKIDIKS